jgi:hypothetical protein
VVSKKWPRTKAHTKKEADDTEPSSPNCQLLLFDLDGTLLDSQKRISPRNLAAIERCRAKGILIGVATARGEATCARYVERIKPEAVISNSGGLIRLHGEILYANAFTEEETLTLIRAGLAEHRGITVDCAESTYCNQTIDLPDWEQIAVTDFSEASGFRDRAFKICIEGTDAAFAERTAALVKDCTWQRFSDCDWCKYSPSDASKEKATQRLEQAMGISKEQIIAFGDDFVDAGMLHYCGVGVAMGNAVDNVKECADVVIGHNDSDAIAEYLENNIL